MSKKCNIVIEISGGNLEKVWVDSKHIYNITLFDWDNTYFSDNKKKVENLHESIISKYSMKPCPVNIEHMLLNWEKKGEI